VSARGRKTRTHRARFLVVVEVHDHPNTQAALLAAREFRQRVLDPLSRADGDVGVSLDLVYPDKEPSR
jgi:hypothetical protein